MAAHARKLELDPKYDNYDFPTTSPTPQSGHPGYTTAEQDAKVHQLRMMLEQGGYHERLDTLTLVRAGDGKKAKDIVKLMLFNSYDFSVQESLMSTLQSRCE